MQNKLPSKEPDPDPKLDTNASTATNCWPYTGFYCQDCLVEYVFQFHIIVKEKLPNRLPEQRAQSWAQIRYKCSMKSSGIFYEYVLWIRIIERTCTNKHWRWKEQTWASKRILLCDWMFLRKSPIQSPNLVRILDRAEWMIWKAFEEILRHSGPSMQDL